MAHGRLLVGLLLPPPPVVAQGLRLGAPTAQRVLLKAVRIVEGHTVPLFPLHHGGVIGSRVAIGGSSRVAVGGQVGGVGRDSPVHTLVIHKVPRPGPPRRVRGLTARPRPSAPSGSDALAALGALLHCCGRQLCAIAIPRLPGLRLACASAMVEGLLSTHVGRSGPNRTLVHLARARSTTLHGGPLTTFRHTVRQ